MLSRFVIIGINISGKYDRGTYQSAKQNLLAQKYKIIHRKPIMVFIISDIFISQYAINLHKINYYYPKYKTWPSIGN